MHSKKLLLLNLGWAAAAVIAFLAGTAKRPPNGTPHETVPTFGKSESRRAGTTSPAGGKAKPAPLIVQGRIDGAALVRPMTAAEIESCLHSGLTSKDPVERDLLISQALAQVTRDNAATLAGVLESLPWNDSSSFEAVFDRFMLAWGRVDGPAAVAYQGTRDKNARTWGDLTENAIRGWAETDPDAALAYLDNAQIPDDRRVEYFSMVLQGLALTDIGKAASLTAGLEAGPRLRAGIEAIGEALQNSPEALFGWAGAAVKDPSGDPAYAEAVLNEVFRRTTDGSALAAWMDGNPDYPYNWRHAEQAVQTWAKADPLAALEWVNRSSDPRVRDRLSNVMSEWIRTDLAAATAWTRANMDDPRIKYSLPSIVGGLATTDPAGAVEWFNRLDPELVTPGLVGDIVRPWAEQSPENALRWAQSLPDKSQQSAALYVAAESWPEDRLNEFDAWLSTAGPEKRLDDARKRLAFRIAERDPRRAFEIANAITDAAAWESVAVHAGRRLFEQNPEVLRNWLPESGLSEAVQRRILGEAPNP